MTHEKRFDVVALGELLVDFTSGSRSPAGMRLFEQNPGGAPANVLCALAKLGMKTAFVGKVGSDMHGQFLRDTLQETGVDTKGLKLDPAFFTTLAFVELTAGGERVFSFARKPGADTQLRPDELPPDLLSDAKIFHFGSLSLTHEPARSATLAAIAAAKDAGAIISYDPNYRARLWESGEEAMHQMRSVLPQVDVMKISDEETGLLAGCAGPEEASLRLLNLGIPCVVVTLGPNGALIRTRQALQYIKAYQCRVVDTTGAGDSFWGGFLYKLLKSGKNPRDIAPAEGADFVNFANAVAALCVQKRGAIPAMPDLESVMELYRPQ